MAKNTYGTGSFVLLNVGDAAPARPGRRPAHDGRMGDRRWRGPTRWRHAIFVTGAAVQWLRDGLGIIARADETEPLAGSLEGNDGVCVVPRSRASARRSRDPYARGTIVG